MNGSRAVVAASVLGIALVSGGWLVERGMRGAQPGTQDGQQVFLEVMAHVARDYVDTIPVPELYDKAVHGMVQELNDPHTVLLSPERLASLTESTSGRYGGVGIQIDVRDGWITVVSPLPGTPAQRAGIETGDRIVEVEGQNTNGWTSDEALKALRGDPGTTVHVLVQRPGVEARLPFSITRREIEFPPVRHSLVLRDGVGYLDLTVFSEDAAMDVSNAVDSLRTAGMHTLIFDLRGDPGGLLDQGVAVADLFLDRGKTIVSMRGRTPDANRTFTDERRQRWPDLRLIALVDSGSASAAEIVAGALQDHDRAVLLGTDTYGKGSAQSLFRVANGGALKLTTALWFTPSGRSINRPTEQADPGTAAEDRVTPDNSGEPRYTTEAGRVVLGGGGITPDLITPDVPPTEADETLERALGEHIPEFRDALTAYALSLRGNHSITSPDFTVTPEMRAELFRRMQQRGIDLDRDVYNAGAGIVDRLLGSEIARYVFGEQLAFARAAANDPTIQTAIDLANRASSQQELIRLAKQRANDPRPPSPQPGDRK